MRFRPCIDIHNGKVKQIVGASLQDQKEGSYAKDNFVAEKDGDYYAGLYKEKGLTGGHVILLNKPEDALFEETKKQALLALSAYPGGLQIGGGINDENAGTYLDAGASHVIVTSFVFRDGRIDMDRLIKMEKAVSSSRLVLDLSVKHLEDGFHIATDRWQKVSDEILNISLLDTLSKYCDEFLIHATDVEGLQKGPDIELLKLLSGWQGKTVSYAGGIKSMEDIDLIEEYGKGKIDYTIGSALDIFGGRLSLEDVCRRQK